MKSIRLHILSLMVIVSFIGLVFSGCNSYSSQKRTITVSIQPQKYFLEKIVGDKFNVVCLLSQGSNPEAYEPSLSHLMNLEKSEAYFRIGNIGFELAILNKAQNNNPNLKIYDNSKGIELMEGSHGVADSHGHKHEVDPHIWSSVPNAMKIASNMYDAVVELDPANEKEYTRNYNKLKADIEQLNQDLSAKLEPLKGSSFAVWHPSLSYFARDYGLNQISIEYEGKEAPIQHLQSRIDAAKKDNVKVFFFQKEFDGRQAEVVNEQIGAKMVTINPMNYHWDVEMRSIADALTRK